MGGYELLINAQAFNAWAIDKYNFKLTFMETELWLEKKI
jgi:hypothetical protein